GISFDSLPIVSNREGHCHVASCMVPPLQATRGAAVAATTGRHQGIPARQGGAGLLRQGSRRAIRAGSSPTPTLALRDPRTASAFPPSKHKGLSLPGTQSDPASATSPTANADTASG